VGPNSALHQQGCQAHAGRSQASTRRGLIEVRHTEEGYGDGAARLRREFPVPSLKLAVADAVRKDPKCRR
jgi:hypothetical protein